MTRVVGVLQARAGSTRLPGKVLRELAGRPVLAWVLRAMQQVEGLDDVVLATTTEAADDPVAALAADWGVDVVRGSVDDVLGRFLLAVDSHPADAVARFTADCPLLDPRVAAMVVAAWRASPDLDHVSTVMPRSLPRGLDAEVASVAALREADRLLQTPELAHHRTHVTSLLYTRPDLFQVAGIAMTPAADDLRVTLDTPDDWALVEALAQRLGDAPPRWQQVVQVLRADPELVALNAHVTQKRLDEG